jgi:tRNA A-37 threonylcarbamoyl transferase component Bud32
MKKCSTCGTLYAGDLCPKCMAGFAQNPTAATQPPEELPLQPGQTFHGLEIVELLGRGGMGVVYKARQPALDRFVALKILPRRMALDPDFQSRFIREAKALGSLSHPNIVLVHDFGAEGDLFFFVMEFVDGVNLRNLLREKKLDPAQAMKIVPQLCDALEFAHAEGIVHRDIKPENILLDRKGRVKIADFGLAKLTGADTPAHMLTMTNMVMGTPHYMAPEQVENPKSVDHRADIYSMGVVFYEMLTGELPIGRFELPSKKVQIDVRLDEVVLKALEKAPDRRYQKASDVKDAVTRATSVGPADSYAPTIMTPVPARKPSRRPLVAMGLVAAAAVVVAVVAIAKREQPVVATTPPVPEKIDLTKLHFGPDERPLGYRFAPLGEKDKLIDRNPFPAKDADTLGRLAKLLDGVGLQNISPSDLKEGYAAIWWGGTAMYALVSPVAERLETQYKALSTPWNRWSYRKGELLVLAHTWRREDRQLFNVLVGMVQKKLELPQVVPDVPLANAMLDKAEFPKDWTAGTEPIGETSLSKPCNYHLPLHRPDGQPSLLYHVFLHESEEKAKASEAALRKSPSVIRHRKGEVLRTGGTVTVLTLLDDSIGGFEKIAGKIRKNMGYLERSFDTILPTAADLPDGYAFDRILTDPKEVIETLGLSGVRPADLPRTFHATLKPHGAIQVLQCAESKVRYAVENQLEKIGPAASADEIVYAVQAPDDVSLDALENRMREKCGYDRNRPRYIKMADARLGEKELPSGLALKPIKAQESIYEAELQGPAGTLKYVARSFNDYRDLQKYAAKDAPYVPGDVLLVKDFIVVHVGGGVEAAWPTFEALEAALRKKMRTGPPELEDFLHGAGLPDGKQIKETAELKDFAQKSKLDPALLKEAWRADSDTILGVLLQARDAKAAEELAKQPGAFRKGEFVAFVRPLEGAVAADAKALTDQLRGRLRSAKP